MATSTLKFVFSTDISKFERDMNRVSSRMKRASKEMIAFAANMTFVTDAFKNIGKRALESSRQTQEAFKKISVGTGATSEALNALLADFKKVNAQTSQSSEQVAGALADLNTRLGISGESLQKMTLVAAEASRLTGQELSGLANETAKAMNAMNLSGTQGAEMIDRLFTASQNTNIGMAELASMTAKYSGVLQASGMSLDQSIAALASFSNAGLNTQSVMKGITTALNKFAKSGVKDAGTELNKTINSIRTAATESKAAQLAVEMFGASGISMAKAIRMGHFEIGELTEKLRTSSGAVSSAAQNAGTFADSWARTMKNLQVALEPIGNELLHLGDTYVLPVLQSLGDFTAAGNRAVVTLGALAVASGPLLGALGGLSTSGLTLFRTLLKTGSAVFNFCSVTLPLKGLLTEIGGTLSVTSDKALQLSKGLLNGSGVFTSVKYAAKGLLATLSGPAGLLLALGAVASYFAYDYVSSTVKASQETAAFQRQIEKLSQSLSALSDRELTLKISDTQKQIQEVSSKVLERTQYHVTTNANSLSWLKMSDSELRDVISSDEERQTLKKQLSKLQKELVTILGEQDNRTVQGTVSALLQQFNSELTGAKSTDEARAIASPYVEKLTAMLRERIADSKGGETIRAAAEQINRAAQSHVSASGRAGDFSLAQTAPVKEISENLLEKLRWQNSAGFLSDSDYSTALGYRFQQLTGGKDSKSWTPDARSLYDELERLKKSQTAKADEALKWQNSIGQVSNTDYAAALQKQLFSLTEGTGISQWSEQARGVYDQLRNVAGQTLDEISKRFSDGTISLNQYTAEVTALTEQYGQLPKLAEELNDKMIQNCKTADSFKQSMNKALNETRTSFESLSGTVGTGLTDSFARAAAYGENLGDSLKKLGQDIIYTVTKMLLLQSITNMFGFNGLGGLSGGLKSAKGNVFTPSGVTAFAAGGVVSRPTLFKFAGGTGLMGEAGPEAIMPLERDARGRLGVRSSGSAGVYAPQFHVTVNNSGGGEMSDKQAQDMSRTLRDVIDSRVAEDLYTYKRMGHFGGAFA